MPAYRTPGVYREERVLERPAGLRTGVPAFLGYAAAGPPSEPWELHEWSDFVGNFGPPLQDGFLAHSVRGFFRNEGQRCYVVALRSSLSPEDALEEGLAALESLDTVDLVCAPEIMRDLVTVRPPGRSPAPSTGLETLHGIVRHLQGIVLRHCETLGDRFALLDSLPGADVAEVLGRQRPRLDAYNGALYYPWIRIAEGPVATGGFIPPCGHVAGVYARTDERVGVHKAPANEILVGVLDLEFDLVDADQAELNPAGVNALRAFPGRGIRVWGARTLAPTGDRNWSHVNVRRLFLTAHRWIEHSLAGVSFESNEFGLWSRISRELTAYFTALFQQGALQGSTPAEAFYVKCDADTNPPEIQAAGLVVTEIGLAPARPNEFVVVRITHGAGGISTAGPRPGP